MRPFTSSAAMGQWRWWFLVLIVTVCLVGILSVFAAFKYHASKTYMELLLTESGSPAPIAICKGVKFDWGLNQVEITWGFTYADGHYVGETESYIRNFGFGSVSGRRYEAAH
jgi:hypothetical protein